MSLKLTENSGIVEVYNDNLLEELRRISEYIEEYNFIAMVRLLYIIYILI